MTIQTAILIVVIIALIVMAIRAHGKIMVLEYRILLLTEAFAIAQEGEGSSLAKQTRAEIDKKYFLFDKIMQQ